MLPLSLVAVLAIPALALPGGMHGAQRSVAQTPLGIDDLRPHESLVNADSALPSSSGSSGNERYEGHQVWRFDWSTVPRVVRDEMVDLLETYFSLDIWRVSAKTIDVRLPPHLASSLPDKLGAAFGVRALPFVDDVQQLLDGAPRSLAPDGGWNVSSLDSPFHDGYFGLDDVYSFGDALVEQFGSIVHSFDIGETAEGRPLKAWSAKLDSEPKPDAEGDVLEFIVTGGQHAREWVSVSAAFYFLHSLLVEATENRDSHSAQMLKTFTVTVIPVINPDGYTYSHDHSRLWKKNRQNVGGLLCKGIDLNGNWGYQFQPSRLACSDSYKGTFAFEAHETRAVANYIVNGTKTPETEGERPEGKVMAFVDLHSYGQLFMFPFSYSCADFPADAENLMEAGLGVAKAMRTTAQGEGYQCGQACDLTYRSTGEAIDYTYGSNDVRWSYSAELRDTGTYGFVLPPRLIRPTGVEVSAGLLYLASFIYETDIDK